MSVGPRTGARSAPRADTLGHRVLGRRRQGVGGTRFSQMDA
jgi:hypothetical protein